MDDRVAIQFYQSIPKLVTVSGEQYVFVVKANISLAWIKPEHVDSILKLKKHCCAGQTKPAFHLANEDHIRRWAQGGGR